MNTANPANPTNPDLAKTYDPAAVEAEAYRVWLAEKAFHADPAAPGDPYTIVIPPPNVTGALHLGHAINNTLQDILIRMHRMAGFNALWVPGIDHAGIATQAVVEKQLKEKENQTRHDVGREGLVERIWKWKEQYGDRIVSQLKRLGCSCDWDRTRFTLDEQCARAVRHTFFKLFKDGLIYRGKRLVNWDVFLQTSVSDDEIYHETVKTSLWHIRYPIVESAEGLTTENTESTEKRQEEKTHSSSPLPSVSSVVHPLRPQFMTVATTRPETMLGDTAVAVHSEDPRWNWAIGKSVRLPLTGRLVPIIADDILVDPKFGSGVVKVTPAHDPNDYAVYQRHLGKPDEIGLLNLLTNDGKINADDPSWSAYAGMGREAARKKVVADLEAAGLLEKEEPYETQVGHSDRSKTPIEPYLSDQWFVKMAPLAEPALEVVREGIIKFFPERHAQQYLAWLGEKRDWPISRQLWWGHRIPVWTRVLGVEVIAQSGSLQASVSGLTIDKRLDNSFPLKGSDAILARQTDSVMLSDGRKATAIHICVAPDHPEMEEELRLQGFEQDPDVLDTWFSSALWPHSTLGWPSDTPELDKYYPTSVLLTGRDIITLWVARMVMFGIYNMGDGQFLADSAQDAQSQIANRKSQIAAAIPFDDVVINPTILDGKGERMSKSKGNGVDPVDIIDSHGADALRFTLATMATETQDARMPVQVVCPHCGERLPNPEGKNPLMNCPKCKRPFTRPLGTEAGSPDAPLARMTSEKFDLGRNFCNKLWNATRFTLANVESIAPEPADESRWTLIDRWIVSRLNRAVDECDKALEAYRFDQYAKACYDFFWRDFCDWYVEAIKPALKDPKRAGQTATVLASVLDGALRLMHPVIPFITETLWWRLNAVRPQRGLPGRIDCPMSKRLVKAPWPTVGNFAEAAEHIFPRIQEVIGAIRNLRNEHGVKPTQTVTVSILAPGDSARSLTDNRGIVELLATCTLKEVRGDLPAVAHAARATAAGCEVYVEGLVDEAAEKQRRATQCEKLAQQIRALRGRLANPSYADKAPAKLVQQTRDQLAAAEAEFAKLGCEGGGGAA